MSDDEKFGYSLALDDGDLAFEHDVATGLRRLRLIRGKRNLIQALQLRILTPYGTDRFNTRYGLDLTSAFTQPVGIRMVKELIKLNLVRTLGTDARVRDIREVLFQDDPAYLAHHPELTAEAIQDAKHRRFWQVDVVIDTVENQTTTISAKVGV